MTRIVVLSYIANSINTNFCRVGRRYYRLPTRYEIRVGTPSRCENLCEATVCPPYEKLIGSGLSGLGKDAVFVRRCYFLTRVTLALTRGMLVLNFFLNRFCAASKSSCTISTSFRLKNSSRLNLTTPRYTAPAFFGIST